MIRSKTPALDFVVAAAERGDAVVGGVVAALAEFQVDAALAFLARGSR